MASPDVDETCAPRDYYATVSSDPQPLLPVDPSSRARTSRARYRGFVSAYRDKRLDQLSDELDDPSSAESKKNRRKNRKEYLREYFQWLWPHRWRVASVFTLALIVAGLQMIEPLFMRYIIDRVLLNEELDAAGRLRQLNLAGATFLIVVIVTALINVAKDYLQKLLNIKVMLSLRRSLF